MRTSDLRKRDQRSTHSSSKPSLSRRTVLGLLGAGSLGVLPGHVIAHSPDGVTDDPGESLGDELYGHGAPDPSQPLIDHDTATRNVVSDGPSAHVTKNFELAGRGERLLEEGTTDVWVHSKYAYIGTFESPCGTGVGFDGDALVADVLGPGIAVFDVRNPLQPEYVGNVPSVAGSRINDVKVANVNAGAILVHSNEPCSGGPGGFEIYDVEDPTAPVHLAHVQTDDINEFLRDSFGFTDFGVHNLFLFTQGKRDYVAAVVESEFGNFQLFEITDPTNPTFVGAWGAESLLLPGVDWFATSDLAEILEADAYLFDGFGSSQNRFLLGVTVSADGTRAYLANWDAGLVLLDISDPADPKLVSQAIDTTAGDGELNSHAAWPSEDGTVVVETGEDFDPFSITFEITGGPNAGTYPAVEGGFGFATPIAYLPDGTMSGPTVYVGLACDASSVPPAPSPDHIAVIDPFTTGDGCRDDVKFQNVIDAGYAGIVVIGGAPFSRGDALKSGEPHDIPIVFVDHSTGLAIFDVLSTSDLDIGASGAPVEAVSEFDRWGNVRIWDYSDEANPVLASEFDTRCSADPGDESCDLRGVYSAHNVIVERGLAYISWYSDGMLVVDISDPYDPVEVARYNPGGEEFEAQNGGIQDVWGVYKEPNKPWIYGSDRNGGLYVLKLLGSGSGR